jgi:hypothetical protein
MAQWKSFMISAGFPESEYSHERLLKAEMFSVSCEKLQAY